MILYISMFTMLIGHVGHVFFPELEILRVIGRLSFPLYAFGVVQGYIYTKSLKNYLYRLLGLAVISQIPFMLALGVMKLNVVFTFFICILVLWVLDNWKMRISIPVTVIFMIMSMIMDYGIYGILLVLVYRYLGDINKIYAHTLLNIIFLFLSGWFIQLFSIVGTLLIINRDKLKKIKVNKLFYLSFYPVHLFLIMIWRLFL